MTTKKVVLVSGKYKGSVGFVNIENFSCTCRSFTMYRLPCCHVFAQCLNSGSQPPVSVLPQHFYINYDFGTQCLKDEKPCFDVLGKTESKKKKLSDRNKFSMLKPEIDRFVSTFTNLSNEKFIKNFEMFKTFQSLFE